MNSVRLWLFAILLLSTSTLASFHQRCFLFEPRSRGSITVQNDWNWRASLLIYNASDVWNTDIPVLVTESEFMQPHWGQHFGRCTEDVHLRRLCYVTDKFLLHDAKTDLDVYDGELNRFVLAGSEYVYNVKTDDASVVCAMLYQDPKVGSPNNRVTFLESHSHGDLPLETFAAWVCALIEFVLLLLILAVHSYQQTRRATRSGSVVSGAEVLLLYRLFHLISIIITTWARMNMGYVPSRVAFLLFSGEHNWVDFFMVIGVFSVLHQNLPLNDRTKRKLGRVLLSTMILPMMPYSALVLLVFPDEDGAMLAALEHAAVASRWLCYSYLAYLMGAPIALQKLQKHLNNSSVRYCYSVILYLTAVLTVIGPVSKLILILATGPTHKIHFKDYLQLSKLFTHSVPARIQVSLITQLLIHVSRLKILGIILVFMSAPSSHPSHSHRIPRTSKYNHTRSADSIV